MLALARAFAAPSVAAAESPADGVTAPAGGGLPAVGARVLGSAIAYRACAGAPCVAAAGDASIALPVGSAAEDVVIDALAIGGGRHALFAHTPTFGALITGSATAREARVLWSGAMGFAKGEPGERYGEFLEVTDPESD